MHHVVVMEVIDRFKNLSDRLRSVFLCELAVLANSVEKLASRSQLSDDIILVL